MFALAKGAVAARILGIASIPILTRIYSPEDYGILALYVSLVAMVAPILSLRYAQAVPLPKTDAIAINLFAVCLKLILCNSLVVALFFAFFGRRVFDFLDMGAISHWWPFIVLGAAGTALYELFSFWATRKKQYKILALTQVMQSFSGNLIKVVLGVLAVKPLGLIVGQVVAQSGGVGNIIRHSFIDFKKLIPEIKNARGEFVVRYYCGFPLYRLPSQILMVISLQAPVLMTAALYSKELTGQLSLAILALSLPVSLIGGSISKAYYAEIASLGKEQAEKIKRITLDVQKKLFSVGIPMTILAILVAEELFGWVFGVSWETAGRFSAILAPFMLFQLTSAPLMEVVNVLGSQVFFLVLNFIRVMGLGGVFILAKWSDFHADDFVLLLSVYLSSFYLLVSVFIFMILRRVH